MNNVFSSMAWKFTERIASQLVSFMVSVILARLLLPEQYGIIAKVMVFISIADVFVTTGLCSALIQKKDSDDLDFSSMFYLNIGLSFVLYLILFICAPAIGHFFNDTCLSPVLQVLGLKLLFSAYLSIQQAYISRYMLFRSSAIAALAATACSAAAGVSMAYLGAGVWALAAQQLVLSAMQVLFLVIFINWRPKLAFSWHRAKTMLGFGNIILLAGLLDTISGQLRTLVVGKYYNDEQLAYYNRGDLYPQTLISSVSGTMHTVLFAAYSQEQEHIGHVKLLIRNGMKRSSYLIFTMLTGLACVAEPLIQFMLTDKWLPCVPYMQIACASYATWIMQIAGQEAIIGLGYGKDYLIITIIRSAFHIAALLVLSKRGIMAIAIGSTATNILSSLLVCRWTYRHLHYKINEQLTDLLPALLISLCIAGVTLQVSKLPFTAPVLLITEVISGVFVCVIISAATKNESFYWILSKLKVLLSVIDKKDRR